jgi:hypothetical protein
MRKLAMLCGTATLLLAGCGKANLVAVKRPVKPIWICESFRLSRERTCPNRFDAGSLVGLRLRQAERLAAAHGYNVRRVAPLGEHEMLILDLESSRLNVETDSTSEQSTVVRFVEQG